MDFSLQSTKDYYIKVMQEEKEASYRKTKGKHIALWQHVLSLPGPQREEERLCWYLYNLTSVPKCINPKCQGQDVVKFNKVKNDDKLHIHQGYPQCCSIECGRQLPSGFATAAAIAQRTAQANAKNAAFQAEINKKKLEGTERCKCGEVARFYEPQNKRWRCTDNARTGCPITVKLISEGLSNSMAGVARSVTATKIDPADDVMCYYGCGEVAEWQLSESCGGKLCCHASHQACTVQRKKFSTVRIEKYKDPKVKAEFLARLNATLQENYGVNWPMQIEGVNEKRGDNMEAKYGAGVRHNSSIPGLKERNIEHIRRQSSFKIHEYPWSDGSVVPMRGYEDMACDDLRLIYDESQIRTEWDKLDPPMPKIPYWKQGEDHSHAYNPDIWIPHENLIIEVKALRYYCGLGQEVFQINKLKEQATKDAGYEFIWLIYKGRGKGIYTLEEIEELDGVMEAQKLAA